MRALMSSQLVAVLTDGYLAHPSFAAARSGGFGVPRRLTGPTSETRNAHHDQSDSP